MLPCDEKDNICPFLIEMIHAKVEIIFIHNLPVETVGDPFYVVISSHMHTNKCDLLARKHAVTNTPRINIDYMDTGHAVTNILRIIMDYVDEDRVQFQLMNVTPLSLYL